MALGPTWRLGTLAVLLESPPAGYTINRGFQVSLVLLRQTCSPAANPRPPEMRSFTPPSVPAGLPPATPAALPSPGHLWPTSDGAPPPVPPRGPSHCWSSPVSSSKSSPPEGHWAPAGLPRLTSSPCC
ncbi:sulfated surface glycoprotein 185-like [Acanthaster planci]|uniref:Sulfated surface glycoprotein 185-like n=1 Tax=Acanthaster planci TaxID=133434 RepID=A0A8B8A414_ACAPL|nr:sulfated surface glycoprotein 185-like [Acanthaster planci]